jgi:dTDP-glucose pyrophosphorylase
MINILIPLGGKSLFFDDPEYPYPKPFIEINGRPMIDLVLAQFGRIRHDKKFIFVIKQEDCEKHHLDSALKLLTAGRCEIVLLRGDTKGAVCSALMAIDHINNDDGLIIANGDSIVNISFDDVISEFERRESDAGVVCFESIHPKFSYVRLDHNNKIIETAEKNPISKNAIAGFYYFRRGRDFVRTAMLSIEKDSHVDGNFFIAPTFNELVLENKNLDIIKISDRQYHQFYSPQKIREYEEACKK